MFASLQSLLRLQSADIPLPIALRDTFAIVAPMAVGLWLGHFSFALGMALGAMLTMSSDVPGPYRIRIYRIVSTALAGAVAAFVGSMLGHELWAFGPILLFAAFVGAYLVALSAQAARMGMVGLIILIVFSHQPVPLHAALLNGAGVLAGGVWLALVAVAAWPLRPYGPEQQALASSFETLAAYALATVDTSRPAALPPSLNNMQVQIFGPGHARGAADQPFAALAVLAEGIRLQLHELRCRQAAAQTQEQIGALQKQAQNSGAALQAIAAVLQKPGGRGAHHTAGREQVAATPQDDSMLAAQISKALRMAIHATDKASDANQPSSERAQLKLPASLLLTKPWDTLRANLRKDSPTFRHALRVSICAFLGWLLAQMLHLPHGYWLPMTTIIVLKPDFGATKSTTVMRIIGTLLGIVVVAGLFYFTGMRYAWTLLLPMAGFIFLFRAFKAAQYGIAVIGVSGAVVILLTFFGESPTASALARGIATTIGGILALLSYILWPTWESGHESTAITRLLQSTEGYLLAVFDRSEAQRDTARLDVQAAKTGVQASLARMTAELHHTKPGELERTQALLAQNELLASALLELEAERIRWPGALEAPWQIFAQKAEQALQACAAAVADGKPPAAEALQTLDEQVRNVSRLSGSDNDLLTPALQRAAREIAVAIHGMRDLLS